MNQRLALYLWEDMSNEDAQCKAVLYFHWGAYPIDSFFVTYEFCNAFFKNRLFTRISDLRLRAIKVAEYLGGGILNGVNSVEFNYVQTMYPQEHFKDKGINKNRGLVAISPEGMQNISNSVEGQVHIDLKTNRIYNDLVRPYASLKDLIHAYELDNNIIPQIQKLSYNPIECSIDDITQLYNSFMKVPTAANCQIYMFKNNYYYL